MPCYKIVDGEKLLRMGFLASTAIGALAGVGIDGNVATAFGWGMMGPYAIEKVGQRYLNGKK